MEELTKEGAQDRIEQQVLKRQQRPFLHTRKKAIKMAAEQMVSSNPMLQKVSLISKPKFMQSLSKLIKNLPLVKKFPL